MIEVAHLYRRFGNLSAVEDLSFQLEKGEVVGFLGPNGAGKTTTMRILTGFLPASKARRVTVAGFDVLRESMQVRKHIGYLPEAVPLYKELRVQEMLQFHGRLHRMSSRDLKSAIPGVLERVGVLDRRRQLVGNLSRGLKQRVGLAVALLPNPQVLILDEPTSGLDPLQRREVRSMISELAQDHTVLLSSHILAEIEMICPRVIVLDRGRLLADGRQSDLIQQLAGSRSLRVEAACGADPSEAARLLRALPGVQDVRVGERLGIHQSFEVLGDGDLREDVGALALQRGWALRELSMPRQTLEEVFAKLISGTDGQDAGPVTTPVEASVAPPVPVEQAAGGLISLGVLGEPPSQPPAGQDESAAKPSGRIYSLNPFDRGASRDLSKPVDANPGDGEPEDGDPGGGGASDGGKKPC